jgi:tRNA(Ile)-lysidine synthase
MAEAMAHDGVEILATAHHLADQAETVLMRLAHGSGIDGLRGMDRLSFVEGCEIVRPLLGVRPEILREVVSDAGLAPADDPSNADENYERVRWRLMLPALEAMGSTVESDYPRVVTPITDTHTELAAGRFAALNRAVATAMLGQVLSLVAGDRRSVPLGALELLAQRLQQTEPLKGITLHGCLVSSDGEAISVKKEGPRRAVAKRNSANTPN